MNDRGEVGLSFGFMVIIIVAIGLGFVLGASMATVGADYGATEFRAGIIPAAVLGMEQGEVR